MWGGWKIVAKPVRYSNSTLAVPPPVTGEYIHPFTVFSSREWKKGVGSSETARFSKIVMSAKDSFMMAMMFTGWVTEPSPSTAGYSSISSSTLSWL